MHLSRELRARSIWRKLVGPTLTNWSVYFCLLFHVFSLFCIPSCCPFQLEELDDKEGQLRILSSEQEKSSRMNQLTTNKTKKEIDSMRKQLTHERNLKLDAFQRVDELQTQVSRILTLLLVSVSSVNSHAWSPSSDVYAVHLFVSLARFMTLKVGCWDPDLRQHWLVSCSFSLGYLYSSILMPPFWFGAGARPKSRAYSAGARHSSARVGSASNWPPPVVWPANRSITPAADLYASIHQEATTLDLKKMQRPKTVSACCYARDACSLCCSVSLTECIISLNVTWLMGQNVDRP